MTNKSTAREEFEKETLKLVGAVEGGACMPTEEAVEAIMTALDTFIESIAVEVEERERFIWKKSNHTEDCELRKFNGNCQCGLEADDCLDEAAHIIRSHKST